MNTRVLNHINGRRCLRLRRAKNLFDGRYEGKVIQVDSSRALVQTRIRSCCRCWRQAVEIFAVAA